MVMLKSWNFFTGQVTFTSTLPSFITDVTTFLIPWLWSKTNLVKFLEDIRLWYGTKQKRTGVPTKNKEHSFSHLTSRKSINLIYLNSPLPIILKEDLFSDAVICLFRTMQTKKNQVASSLSALTMENTVEGQKQVSSWQQWKMENFW